ncbi:MAG: SGNH/GDSL hydrolase family protein [Muribaculaceae bacterium]|nr:SGNH/GDSL hydrolase family protein [Muribaculaceae bacterium]
MNKISRLLFTLTAIVSFLNLHAEGWKWYNPMDAGFPVVQNQGWTSEIGNTYYRLPDRAMGKVRGPVWNLSRHSSGLAIHFYSNAPQIKVRYIVDGELYMRHMPPTGVSGLDLYGTDQDGKSRRFFGFFNNKGDTIFTRFVNDRMKQFHDKGYEFQMYLPLYNSVRNLEIGIPDSCSLNFIPVSDERPIVLYGTSIEHGAVASRPGMAWATQVQRALGYPLINLGFSGNGRLEQEMLDFMAEIDARLYILGCLANLTKSSPAELDSLITNAVTTLRKANDAPIIIFEHPGFSDAPVNSSQQEIIDRLNSSAKKTFAKLQAEGVENIYYITREELGIPEEGWVDDVHPSDLGMTAMAKAVEKVAREALKIPVGTIPTAIPVTQRREAAGYEWKERHNAILERNRVNPPKAVIIGNSITHFWGGEPTGHVINGKKIWDKKLAPAGFGNLGFGWDRIENALWRVYHGELDGYDAEEVVIMLGTNNLGYNSTDEISEGLRFLIRAIRERQPNAKIKMVGILPRYNDHALVNEVNSKIEKMAGEEGCIYLNPGVKLLNEDGSLNETLFTDRLHPNEKGYARIVDDILK